MSVWIPRWRQKELSGYMSTQRLAIPAKKALVLGDISVSRPSRELSGLVLEAMGATYASQVHALGEGTENWEDSCDPALFLAHARDEEIILFPRILQIAKAKDRNDVRESIFNLLEDHAKFMEWFETGAYPPRDLVLNHGMIEDSLIWEFREDLAPELFGQAKVSGDPIFMSTGTSDADAARAIMNSAAKFYESSEAKDDSSKLAKLSQDYPDKWKAQEKEADAKYKEILDTTRKAINDVVGTVFGTAATVAIAAPLAVMTVYFYLGWEASKKFFKWVFNVGGGFKQEWVDLANARVAELTGYNVVPPGFQESYHVSPMGYAKELAKDINIVKFLDRYHVPGSQKLFMDTMGSIWRSVSSNSIVREDIGKVASDSLGWLHAPMTVASGNPTVLALTEAIGISAARDEKAPVFLYKRAVEAARIGWDVSLVGFPGEDPSTRQSHLARKELYDGADFEDGDKIVAFSSGALAVSDAYYWARREVKKAMGKSGSMLPDSLEESPIASLDEISLNLVTPSGTSVTHEKQKKALAQKPYVFGAAGAGVLALAGIPIYLAALPLAGAWGYSKYKTRKQAQEQAQKERAQQAKKEQDQAAFEKSMKAEMARLGSVSFKFP